MPNKTKDGILFLDFDGVLHGDSPKELFCQLYLVENWLRGHPEIQVVISSSWREVFAYDVIIELFPSDLQDRIIGSTPCLRSSKYCRYEEIMAWIDQTAYRGHWVALDDADHEFPPECTELVRCNPETGIDGCVLDVLTSKVASWTR